MALTGNSPSFAALCNFSVACLRLGRHRQVLMKSWPVKPDCLESAGFPGDCECGDAPTSRYKGERDGVADQKG